MPAEEIILNDGPDLFNDPALQMLKLSGSGSAVLTVWLIII